MSIALGIGANTAIFTLVDEVLLRTLPVKDPSSSSCSTARATTTAAIRAATCCRFRCTRISATTSSIAAARPRCRASACAHRQQRRHAEPIFSGLFARRTGRDERRRSPGQRRTRPSACPASSCRARISRCSASARRSAASSRRTTTRCVATARSRCSATTTGATASARDPGSRRADDHRQQPHADDHRRLAGRLRRPRHRLRAERPRAGDDEGADDAELGRHGQPAQPLGERVRPIEAGRHARAGQGRAAAVLPRTPRAGSAGRGVQQHHRVHARGVPEGADRSAAGRAGPIADPPAAVAAAVAAVRHRRRRAADRVRERREPADRARDGAAEGDRRSARARRQPRPHRRPAARRERAARGDRRPARPRGRVVDDAVPARVPADVRHAARDLRIDRLPRARVQLRAVAGDRPAVRARCRRCARRSRTWRRR